MALLELRGVYKTFNPGTPDEVRALRGVDLTVEPGSFVVVIGTNGSGKSTTLNAVAGSFPVDAGTIRLAGREITGWPEHRRARLIGRVFQDPLAGTSPSLSIAENLALAVAAGPAPRPRPGGVPAQGRRVPRPGQAARHGPGRPARQPDRQPLRRPAPGADPAHGDLPAPRAAPARRAHRRPRPQERRAGHPAHRPGRPPRSTSRP